MSNPDHSTASLPEAAWPAGTRGMLGENAYDADQMRQHFNAGREFEAGRLAALAVQSPTEAAAMAATVPASPHRPSPEWYAAMIQSTADNDFQIGPAFVAAPKDHEIAALVNKLRDVAIEFHGAQQLRVRIAEIIVPALKAMQAPVAGQPAEPSPIVGEMELIEKAVKRVGIESMLNHGAASCVYSEGCCGVTQAHLLAYTREIALQCAVALAAPKGDSNG